MPETLMPLNTFMSPSLPCEGQADPRDLVPEKSRGGNVHRIVLPNPNSLPEGADDSQSSPFGSDRKLELLVVDDDLPVLKACCEIASGMDFVVHAANTSEQAREVIRFYPIDVVLMDLRMPGGGLSLLEEIRRARPRTSVVIMTAFATVSSAVEAMRMGATDYLTKPFAMDELTSILDRAGQRRTFEIEGQRVKGSLRAQAGFGNLVGRSQEMEKLYRIISKVATANHPVLILGESGSGKETVARAIHASGPSATRGFHVLECGQLAPAVLESELFGFARGAYTGFDRSQEPLLASPDGGTVFLDGISEMPLDLQSRLMRVLQDRQITPPGASQPIPLTARVLAGSSRDLAALVAQGQFRKDLYYRLNVVGLRIPALRERREDIPLLLEYFLERMRRERATTYRFSPEAMAVLTSYDWPGNVRELESAIERACALSSGPVLYMGDLPTQMHQMSPDTAAALTRVDERPSNPSVPVADRPSNPIVSIAELEREAILHTIRQLHGDKLMAAKLLGIGKTTLYRKLKEYGISDI
ncbi:sigma-54 dependent transcriptional regulator [Terriglobus sp. TAA 43]|uniref:sigma-54-dependent transcriptional regulator n=1 Tax=Terriglobus sp. TAA 43 TaxID=278961 RepID=UPI0009FDFAF4|nr:sigma-54 dependent transcriptional regulator [Terriglobus sp. TAA 43]